MYLRENVKGDIKPEVSLAAYPTAFTSDDFAIPRILERERERGGECEVNVEMLASMLPQYHNMVNVFLGKYNMVNVDIYTGGQDTRYPRARMISWLAPTIIGSRMIS